MDEYHTNFVNKLNWSETMRLVIQRVKQAEVKVNEGTIGAIGKGLLVLQGIEDADTIEDLEYCVQKLCAMRIFQIPKVKWIWT